MKLLCEMLYLQLQDVMIDTNFQHPRDDATNSLLY